MAELTVTFVSMSPNYWGKGTTLEEAKKNLRDAGGRVSHPNYRTLIVKHDPRCVVFVDDMGGVATKWNGDASKEDPAVLEEALYRTTIERRNGKGQPIDYKGDRIP